MLLERRFGVKLFATGRQEGHNGNLTMMDSFELFVSRLRARLDRADAPTPPTSDVIRAAVLLLLRRAEGDGGEDAEILFIKRAERAGDPWSGHLAFPGGHAEKRDATLLDAAIREAAEEVGIDVREGGRVLGSLPTFSPMSRRLPPLSVTPFVALAPPAARPRLQRGEVDDAFWMALSAMKDVGTSASVRLTVTGEPREWPAYPSPLGPIWGITERILTRFLGLVE
jgi:8-oxo-dGTP pyrophosphatase MutT (NUDIX family)